MTLEKTKKKAQQQVNLQRPQPKGKRSKEGANPAGTTTATTTTTTTTNTRNKPWTTTSSILTILGICMTLSIILTYFHSLTIHQHHQNHKTLEENLKSLKVLSKEDLRKHVTSSQQQMLPHKIDFLKHAKAFSAERRNKKQQQQQPLQLAQLNCEAFGGPMDKAAAQEMVYWQDIATDTHYQSPFYQINNNVTNKKAGRNFYMTFEPDGGGWNNIRMAMETILGLAIATGRILVLPPEQSMYLLRKRNSQQKINFSFQDFFPMHEIAKEQDGLHLITMQQFLEREAMTGHLKNKYTGKVEFPPNNRTNWDGQDVVPLKEWIRNVTLTPLWKPESCMAAFPATSDPKDGEALKKLLVTMHEKKDMQRKRYIDDPIPVDSSPYDRLKDHINGRKDLCLYNTEMQQAPVLHFMCYHKMRVRFLTHFYSFLFLQDWREDLWMKRFMRDHVRYQDEIQCAAARIVQALRQLAQNLTTTTTSTEFDTFHVRRGDFQFKRTRIEPEEIYDNVKEVLPGINEPSSSTTGVIFIATDERKKEFFKPLRKYYPHIFFLDDFSHLLKDVNTNFYGMIDQLVASKGRKFFGCWHSTFTGFINRMRGYHSQNERLVDSGYETGALLNTYYYVPRAELRAMHKYAPLSGPAFNRENPTAWRNLDFGISDIETFMKTRQQQEQQQEQVSNS